MHSRNASRGGRPAGRPVTECFGQSGGETIFPYPRLCACPMWGCQGNHHWPPSLAAHVAAASPGDPPAASPGSLPEASLPDLAAASQPDAGRGAADGAPIEGKAGDEQKQSPDVIPAPRDSPAHSGSFATQDRRERRRRQAARVEAANPPLQTLRVTARDSISYVTVLSVVSPGEFYCRPVETSATLATLLERMDEYYSGAPGLPPPTLTEGSVCCAQSAEDCTWYRARVLKNKGATVDVQFFDYGDWETVPKKKVRALATKFHLPAIQVLKCSLFNVGPEGSDWDPTDVEAFREKLLHVCVPVRFRKRAGEGAYEVQIVTTAGAPNIPDGLRHVKSLVSDTDPLTPETFQPRAQLETVCSLQALRLSSSADAFARMMVRLQAFCCALPDGVGLVHRPKAGVFCVARFTQDDAWYRCLIEEVRGRRVQVRYVDYGNREQVGRQALRYLARPFCSVPCQALQCVPLGVCALQDPGQA